VGSERLALLDRAPLRISLLVASGLCGALAFPATDWWLFAWVWLAPALCCGLARPPRAALADGWLAGTVFFVVLLRWLDHTFLYFSAIPWPITWLPIAALAAYCGLYVALTSAAVSWLRGRIGAGAALALVPPLWVAGEWLRGWLMGGFPWGLLGYSQHVVLPVIQIAEIAGVYGVSFLIVAVNCAIAAVVGLGWRPAAPGVALVAVALGGSLAFGWQALAGPRAAAGREIRVGLIQPSIEQTLKWDPAEHARILDTYEALTRQAAQPKPALILWPETATTIFLRGDGPLLERLVRLAGSVETPLLVGSIDRQEGPDGRFLNSAFLLTGQGITGKYDKIHLVPFGEYVPLGRLIGFVRSWAEFISDFGVGETYTVFRLPEASFGTVICYEVIFPELFRDFVTRGADFMVNITNDAWFGRTSGPWQHLGMLPLRAVEHRVAIARAANTGISAFVEPSGRVARALPLFERGVLDGAVKLRSGSTLYTRWGDWLVYASLAVSALGFGWALFGRSSRACSVS
jgi:apolipoprotein N-acyltransferase